MSVTRGILWIVVLSIAAAGVVALISRTPAHLRERGGLFLFGRNETPQEVEFPDELVAKHGAYRRAGYTGIAVATVLEIAVLVILARGLGPSLLRLVQTLPGGWAVHAAAGAAAIALILVLAALPLSYVRGYVIQHAWDLSTQDFGGWVGDKAKGIGIALVIAAITALAFFGLVRWQPRAWWLIGWAVFSLLTAAFSYIWPVVIAPLFNKFEPLERPVLVERIRELADRVDVDVDEVLVSDASRRTTTENAYVAGLGSTRRVVVYDNLVENYPEDQAMFVVAHELGHESENHVLKFVALGSAGLFVGFAALRWLAAQPGFWQWGGAAGVGDLRALPLLLLFATVGGLLALPIQNAVSRSFERRADKIAIELTQDPGAAVEAFRHLALTNLADLRPPRLAVWLLFSHPPITERMEAVAENGLRP